MMLLIKRMAGSSFCRGSAIFLIFYIAACASKKESQALQLIWANDKAVGIAIPHQLLSQIPADSLENAIAVSLISSSDTKIFGHISENDTAVIFRPLIPFTAGLSYNLNIRNGAKTSFSIPESVKTSPPEILSVYPSGNVLPENLLKVYIRFSHPMREGVSGQFVQMIRNEKDTLQGTFLDLQPELWNEDRTQLTLWLDPGRIKRDLHPNLRYGAPLAKGNAYQLRIQAGWQDQSGRSSEKNFVKEFTTSGRDSLSPDPHKWDFRYPVPGSNKSLEIRFNESLDQALLVETIVIYDPEGHRLTGIWTVGDNGESGTFTPSDNWRKGRYTTRIETRLEDLVGNNINRPFERQVGKDRQKSDNPPYVEIPFVLQ